MRDAAEPSITNQSNERIPWKPFNFPFGAATDINWLLLIQRPVAGGGAPDSLDYVQPYRGIADALRDLSLAINYT